jgi:DJ-1/PfpI family
MKVLNEAGRTAGQRVAPRRIARSWSRHPRSTPRGGTSLAQLGFDGARKPIAFICHADWVPISAKIVKGRRATSVAAIRDDMVNAGVDWVDQAVVVDGNLISARTPQTSARG